MVDSYLTLPLRLLVIFPVSLERYAIDEYLTAMRNAEIGEGCDNRNFYRIAVQLSAATDLPKLQPRTCYSHVKGTGGHRVSIANFTQEPFCTSTDTGVHWSECWLKWTG